MHILIKIQFLLAIINFACSTAVAFFKWLSWQKKINS